MPALSLAALIAAAIPSAPSDDSLSLVIRYDGPAIAAKVDCPPDAFLAAVILAADDQLVHYFAVLPPLLADFVVLGVGVPEESVLELKIPQSVLPAVPIYAQAIAAGDAILGSDVVKLPPPGQ
jgi:hypothetical protein